MTQIVIMGICGQMGHALYQAAAESKEFTVTAGVDRLADAAFACPIYSSLEDISEDFDVIIDFSVPAVLESELNYAKKHRKPVVICTTGLTEEHRSMLQETAKEIPVFNSGNMSLGVNLQMQLLRQASAALGTGFDVEIVERHHRKKVDAPSGTALMLADAVNSQREEALEHKYGRGEKNRRRPDNEIGFHSVRGGTIVGEHEVSFIGQDEIVEITHKAFSKRVFAEGALRAAAFLAGKTNGFYDMELMLSEQDTAPAAIEEQPAVLLTVAAPNEEAALLAEVMSALNNAAVKSDLLNYLPMTNELVGMGIVLKASELGTALEALQPLQVAHETLDVQVQGGVTLLKTAGKVQNTLLPQLAAENVQPLLFHADTTSTAVCVKNSVKTAAIKILQSID